MSYNTAYIGNRISNISIFNINFLRNKSTFWKIEFFYFEEQEKALRFVIWYTDFLPKKRTLSACMFYCYSLSFDSFGPIPSIKF